jgi:hypothetical protein
MPIWTDSVLPSTGTRIFPFRYQPKEPVENCFTSASSSWPLMTTLSGSAFSANWARVTGHAVLAMGPIVPQMVRGTGSRP